MKQACILVLAIVAFAPCVLGQDGMPMIKATVMSAFVWGEDSTSGSRPTDRQCDTRMSYAGIEVSSWIGFERVSTAEVGTFLNYTTTIVNSKDSTVSVRHGAITVDGTRHHLSGLCSRVKSSISSIRRNAKANQTWWSSGKSNASRADFFPATTSFRQTPHLKFLPSPPEPR
jgi:hypothetical protein